MTTICYRCEECCMWDDGKEEIHIHPHLLDFPNPSCPDDSPMPDEFKDSFVDKE